MMTGILQPGYLPWLGFFEQVARCDVFVLYDDVRYDKDGWRNRNRIKTANGAQWLTVPVVVRFDQQPLISEVMIDDKTNWRKKHLASIRQNYSKAPFFKDYIGIFDEAYSMDWEYLADLDMHFILKLCGCMGLGGKNILRSSTLGIEGGKIDRLIAICRHFGADTFYEGASGRNYIEESVFEENGIKLRYQDYKHPVYNQLYGDFIPYLSAIDLLFNHGGESLSILTNEKPVKEAILK